jgi:DNA processing protein
MDKNILYYLGFSCFSGIGPVRFKKLCESFESVSGAYWATERQLEEVLDKNLARRFMAFRNIFDPVKKLEELKRKGINVLSQEDRSYPINLKNISDPPVCLYVKGTLKHGQFFSVVGTRLPTLYGQKVTYELAYGLAKAGFTIVSGMAQGIDGIAHWATIDAKGATVAVLGCVDFVYPAIHNELYKKIIESNGAIISEFPPGSNVVKGMFVSRNRLISGLSQGVLVVEGGGHSGTLITASYAANQGKDIFAVPGQITTDSACAPNILLKQGAKMVTELQDILEEYGIVSKIKRY